MRARVGESTSETKVVAARSWIVVGTSSIGLMRDEIKAGMNFSMSLLETSAQSLVSEARAAFLTSALVSASVKGEEKKGGQHVSRALSGLPREKNYTPQMASTMTGMMSGMRRAH